MVHRILPAVFLLCTAGCVSLDYYEALREAYERAELRGDALKAELSKTHGELAQLQQQADDLKRTMMESSSANLLREKRALMSTVEQLRNDVIVKEEQRVAMARELESTRRALQTKDEEISRAVNALQANLRDDIAKGTTTVSRLDDQVTIILIERILYDSGSAEIKQEGYRVLRRIGEALKTSPDMQIRVEGHTDDVPIRTEPPPRYPSNFELSLSRAIGVVRYLREHAGIRATRLSAMGLAGSRPLVSNVSDQARARNRRVEIILMPSR